MNARGIFGRFSSAHPRSALRTTVWLCVAVFWLYIWRVPIWSADDLLFATRSGTAHGAIAWRRVWPLLLDDVDNRVGRTADMLAQFIFSTGPLIGVIMAACCFLQSYAIWRLLRAVAGGLGPADGVVGQSIEIVGIAAGIGAPLTMLAVEPQLAGSTVMFMAANVGYVLGSAMMVAAAVLLWRMRVRGPAVWQLVLVVAFACVVDAHHELLALGIAGFALGLALVTGRADWRPSWAIALVIVLAVSFGRYTARGLWKRQDRLLRPFPIDDLSTVQQHRVLSVFAVSQTLGIHPELYICLACATAALAWAVRSRIAHRRAFAVALGVFAIAAVATAVLAGRVRKLVTLHARVTPRATVYASSTSTLLLLATAVAVVAFVALIVMMRGVAETQIVVPLAGMVLGLYSMPVLLGSPYGRTLYVPMLSCVVLTVAMAMLAFGLARPAGEGAERVPAVRVVAALLAAASIGPAVQGGSHLVTAVDSNIAVWQPVLRQLRAAEQGRTERVVIPRNMPRADYAQDYTGGGTYYQGNLAKYYGVEASVRIVAR